MPALQAAGHLALIPSRYRMGGTGGGWGGAGAVFRQREHRPGREERGYSRITSTTRRFWARPSRVPLSATGSLSP